MGAKGTCHITRLHRVINQKPRNLAQPVTLPIFIGKVPGLNNSSLKMGAKGTCHITRLHRVINQKPRNLAQSVTLPIFIGKVPGFNTSSS